MDDLKDNSRWRFLYFGNSYRRPGIGTALQIQIPENDYRLLIAVGVYSLIIKGRRCIIYRVVHKV
jgi:hypothetical protein